MDNLLWSVLGGAAQYIVVFVDYGSTDRDHGSGKYEMKKLRTVKPVKRNPVSREVVSLAVLIILSFFSRVADSS
jgi:hypothetical protein